MSPAKEDPAGGPWHFDRRIPIALIVTLILQTGAAIWWASSVNSYIDSDRDGSKAMDVRIRAVESANNEVDRRLVRFEVMLEQQTLILTEIRDKMRETRP